MNNKIFLRWVLFIFCALLISSPGHAAISYISSVTQDDNDDEASLTVPVSVQVDDVLLVQVTIRNRNGSDGVTTPSGWTLIAPQDQDDDVFQSLYYRVATATDAGTSYTWDFDENGSRRYAVGMSVFRGVDTANPIDQQNSQIGMPFSSITAPSVTTSAANAMLVAFYTLEAGDQSFSPGFGMTEAYDEEEHNNNDGISSMMAYVIQASAGASGDKQATASKSNDDAIGHLVALNEGGALPIPQPLADYHFDELSWNGSPNEIVDSSGNVNNGNTVGGITTALGKICNAANIPSNNSASTYEAVDTGLDLDTVIGSSGTISLWYNGNSVWNSGSDKRLFDATDGNKYFTADIGADGRVNFWFEDGNDGDYQKTTVSAFTVGAGIWKHLAFVWDVASGTAKIYVDGVDQTLSGGNGGTTAFTGYDTLYFGDNRDASYFTGESSADGLIDEALVFDSVLTSTQIQTIFTNQDAGNDWDGQPRTCPIPIVPVLEYRFDEESWSGIADEVVENLSTGLDGSAVGNTTTISAGQICRAGTFDGTGDYIDVAGIDAYLNTTASLSFWVKSSQLGNNSPWRAPGITGVEQGGGGDDIFWGYFDASGRIGIQKGNGSAALSTAAINDVNWQHVVMTYDSSNGAVQLFIDGSLEASVTSESGDVTRSFSSIGRIEASSGLNFTGQLDELLVFDSVISPDDVSAIYSNQNAGNNYDGSLRTCPIIPCASGSSGELNAVGIKINNAGSNTQINTTTEALAIHAAWLAAGSPATGLIDGGTYNVAASGSSVVDRIDFGGSVHDFTGTLSYPGDGAGVNGSDFLVYTSGRLSLPAGEYTIFVESDDGFSFIMNTLSGDAVSFSTSGSNELRFENPTANSNTGGSFTLGQDSVFDIAAIFYERGGGDYLEISIANALLTGSAPAGYEILRDGALGGKVTFGECPNSSGPDHYEISHSGVGVTCEGSEITITAHDAAHAAFPVSSDTSITVTTSPAVDNIIPSTVTMLAGTSSASFFINETSVLANIDIDVTDGTASDLDDGGAEDALFEFRDTAFRFYADSNNTVTTPIEAQISGRPSNVALGSQSLALRAVRTNTDTGACEAALQGTTAVELAYECNNPTTCTASNLLSITSEILAGDETTTISRNDNGNSLGYINVDMEFNASGEAPFYLNYFDAGEITLHAKKTVVANSPDPAFELIGESNAFVVRPFGFDLDFDDAREDDWLDGGTLNGSGGDTSYAENESGSVYIEAGVDFNMQITAVNWASADDANNDGVPDSGANLSNNVATPNYGQEASTSPLTLSHSLIQPLGEAEGDFSSASVVAGGSSTSFANGVASTLLSWDEVGIIDIISNQGGYLGVTGADIAGRAVNVGRFIPHHFEVNKNDGAFAPACGTFSYIGQAFTYEALMSPSLTIVAKNEANETTENYTHPDYQKLTVDNSNITRDFPVEDSELGKDLLNELTVVSANTNGTFDTVVTAGELLYTFNSADSFTYQKNANSEVGSFDSDLTISITKIEDSDGVEEQSIPTTPLLINPTAINMRYGRFVIQNAFGPETENLSMEAYVEFLFSAPPAAPRYILNTADSCTNFSSTITTGPAGTTGAENHGTIPVGPDGGTSNFSYNSPLSGGNAGFLFTAPGAGEDGEIGVSIDLLTFPWLQYDWNDDGSLQNPPSTTAMFGQYRGHDRIIYWREIQ
jgi:MSHA biogenesis protein MshQ